MRKPIILCGACRLVLAQEEKMRRIVISMIAVGALTFACDQAFAKMVSISGTHSASEIKSACDKAGGLFQQDSGGYGCQTNCKGGSPGNGPGPCAVGCKSDGKCNGQVPDRSTPPRGLGGILHAPSAGIKSSGGNARPKGHRQPVKTGVKPTGGGKAHPKSKIRDHRTKPVVRDHRTNKSSGSTTGGYGGRQHHTPPTVRDHRSEPVVRDHR